MNAGEETEADRIRAFALYKYVDMDSLVSYNALVPDAIKSCFKAYDKRLDFGTFTQSDQGDELAVVVKCVLSWNRKRIFKG